MAKREEAVNMTEQFAEFKELKDIDKTTLMSVLEESFRSVLSKMFGNDDNFDVIVNPDKGDFEIYQNLKVVEDGTVVSDRFHFISLVLQEQDVRLQQVDLIVGPQYSFFAHTVCINYIVLIVLLLVRIALLLVWLVLLGIRVVRLALVSLVTVWLALVLISLALLGSFLLGLALVSFVLAILLAFLGLVLAVLFAFLGLLLALDNSQLW